MIRYDARDTGLSTCLDFTDAPYTLGDMAVDALGVLDALSIPKAHVVGVSMGGMVAQEIAIAFPGRLHTLTSWMSTPCIIASTPTGWSRLDLPAIAVGSACGRGALAHREVRERRVVGKRPEAATSRAG